MARTKEPAARDWETHVQELQEANPDADLSAVPKGNVDEDVYTIDELVEIVNDTPPQEWTYSYYVDGKLVTKKSTRDFEMVEIPGAWVWIKFLPDGSQVRDAWPPGVPFTEADRGSV